MYNKMDQEKYKWKGRFVSKKVYQARCRLSEIAKRRSQKLSEKKIELEKKATKIKLEAEEEKSAPVVKGHRIVDIKHMADQMYCCNCSKPLLLQNIVEEKMTGLASTFSVKCHNCLVINTVKSGREYINPSSGKKVFAVNTKTVLGAIHTGIYQTDVNELCTVLDLPSFDSQIFKQHEQIIGPIIEHVAKESCLDAVAIEHAMKEENSSQ